jgi:hypothetical protein
VKSQATLRQVDGLEERLRLEHSPALAGAAGARGQNVRGPGIINVFMIPPGSRTSVSGVGFPFCINPVIGAAWGGTISLTPGPGSDRINPNGIDGGGTMIDIIMHEMGGRARPGAHLPHGVSSRGERDRAPSTGVRYGHRSSIAAPVFIARCCNS